MKKWPVLIMLATVMSAVIACGNDQAMAQDAPSNGEVYIRNIKYGGTGCPQGSVSEMVAPDNQAFTLLFDSYVAELGPQVSRLKNRSACQIAVDLAVPQGWSYSIATLDYRGYANLDADVIGTQVASYYFQAQPRTWSFSTDIYGKYDDAYQVRDNLELQASEWSPCGGTRALNIKSEVRVRGSRSTSKGILTIDSIDGHVQQVYGLKWRRCS